MNYIYYCSNCNKVFKLKERGLASKCKYCPENDLIDLNRTDEEWITLDNKDKKSIIEGCVNRSDEIKEEVLPAIVTETSPKDSSNEVTIINPAPKSDNSFFNMLNQPYNEVVRAKNRPICRLEGVRGRKMILYRNKCEISTDVTVGSVLTQNATDGKKTIFFIDCIGVQLKKSGLLIGYLQFETASGQMNNLKDNMFAENTFTFEDGKNGITNELIEEIYHYVCDRVEGYKYNDQELLKQPLPDRLQRLYDAQVDVYDSEEAEQVKREERRREAELKELEQRKRNEQLKQLMDTDGAVTESLKEFIMKSEGIERFIELKKLWHDLCLDEFEDDTLTAITNELENNAYMERMYGNMDIKLKNYKEKLKQYM